MELHRKYRPASLDEVVGQDAVVRSLRKMLDSSPPHACLFSGPSGCGKTTLARIVASSVGCEEPTEIDAASNSGVDDMRDLARAVAQPSLIDTVSKVAILDECHRLSKQAWDALLKPIEEPESHVYWLLSTTEPQKVPKTIQTRCKTFALKSCGDDALMDLLERVVAAEDIELGDDVLDLVLDAAEGSPRRLLVALEMCAEVEPSDAPEVLAGIGSPAEIVDLCRLLLNPSVKFSQVAKKLKDIGGDPDGVREFILNYMNAVVYNSKKDRNSLRALEIMSALCQPTAPTRSMAPITVALADMLLEQ